MADGHPLCFVTLRHFCEPCKGSIPSHYLEGVSLRSTVPFRSNTHDSRPISLREYAQLLESSLIISRHGLRFTCVVTQGGRMSFEHFVLIRACHVHSLRSCWAFPQRGVCFLTIFMIGLGTLLKFHLRLHPSAQA